MAGAGGTRIMVGIAVGAESREAKPRGSLPLGPLGSEIPSLHFFGLAHHTGILAITPSTVDPMHPAGPRLKRGYASAPTGQIHYYDSEGAGEVLLLLHQSPTSSTDFALTFPLFQQAGLRVVAVDNPGLGMSSAPLQPPKIADYVSAVLAVLDHLGIAKAHILGHHTGVAVALEAATQSPERVGKLALYGVPFLLLEELQAFWKMIVPAEREEATQPPKAGGAHLLDMFRKVERAFGTQVANSMVVSRLMAGPTLWYSHNAALTHDMRPDFLACQHPMLLITHPGEMLDAATRAAAAARPDAVFVALDQPCAIAMYQAPEALAACVLAFLHAT
jgi:pimeloyl-ACP methyl ester carboxylesterase